MMYSMRPSWRALGPGDVTQAADFVARQPLERRRYGQHLPQLHSIWLALLQRHCIKGVVVEDLDQPGDICGLAVTAFVSDEFVAEAKTAPGFWLGPELVRRIDTGTDAILPAKQIRLANSRLGLNLAAWFCHLRINPASRASDATFMEGFLQEYRGFQFKELFAQPADPPNVLTPHKAGLFRWDYAAQAYDVGWAGQGIEEM